MANLIREHIPLIHAAMEAYLSDPVTYKRSSAPEFETTASLMPALGEEAVSQGNNLRLFMSLSQCGGVEPAESDLITKNGIQYRIKDITADDLDGYFLSLRRV